MRNSQRPSWMWLVIWLLPLSYLVIFGFFGASTAIQAIPASYRNFIYLLTFFPQIVLMAFLLRGSGRSLGKVLGSIIIGIIYYLVISSGYPSIANRLFLVSAIDYAISLVIIPYLAAVILRHLPGKAALQALQLLNWRGLLILLLDILAISLSIILVILTSNVVFLFIALILVFLLNVSLSLKPARLWWRDSDLLAGLFALLGTGIPFLYLGSISYSNSLSTEASLDAVINFITTGMAWFGVIVLVSGLSLLASTGLRFTLEYFPTYERIQQARLLDWRAVVFLGLLAVNLALVMINFFRSGSISLDAAGPLFAIYMLVVVVLYWQPAGRWREDRQAVYPFMALAILGVLLSLIIFVSMLLISAESTSLTFRTQSVLLVYFSCSVSACALVASLPWLQKQWVEQLPSLRQVLPLWKVLVGLVVVDYAIVYMAESGSLFYPLTAGALALAGAYLLAPRLEPWQRYHWIAWLAVIVAMLSLTGILASNEWVNFATNQNLFIFLNNLLSSQQANQVQVNVLASINVIVFALPLLAAFSLALLLHRRIMLRLALAVSILAGAQMIIIYPDRNLDQSGLATGIAWLAIFGSGWLLSSLLPARAENWGVTFLSGFLLLCLSPLLLPVLDDKTDLFSYPVSLPIWSSHQPINSWSSAVSVFLPILLAVVAGTLFFALMLRSGQAMLRLSRTPRPEIVTLGLLILGVCLTLASSYIPTTIDFASFQVSDGWQNVIGSSNQSQKPTFLFADPQRKIWMGGIDGSLAWVMMSGSQIEGEPVYLKTGTNTGVLQIAVDETGRVWALTDQALAAIDQDTGKILSEFSNGQMANELGNLLGGSLQLLTFYIESENRVWLGTSLGLARLNLEQIGSRPSLEDVSLLPTRTRITQVGRDSQGHLWALLPEDKNLMVELISPGQMARSLPAGSSSIDFKLDLTKLPAGTPVALNITVQLKEGVLLTAQAKSKDNQYRCLNGLQTSQLLSGDSLTLVQNIPDKKYNDACLVTSGNLPYAVNMAFPLDDFAGTSTTVRLGPWNADSFAGDWLLLAAWVSPVTPDGQVKVLFSPADCLAQVDKCVLPGVPQDMVLYKFDGQVLVWDDSIGPIYAQTSSSTVNDTNWTNPILYRHTGLSGLLPITLQKPEPKVYSFFVGGKDQVLALTDSGLQKFNSDTGVYSPEANLASMTLYDITAVMFRGGRIWVAGKIQSSDLGIQGPSYAIERYDGQQRGWVLFRNIPLGTVKQMALDADNVIWALIQDKTYQPNSIWWFIIPVVGFIAIGVNEYVRQPTTLAGRIRRRLRQAPNQALPVLYEVLRTDRSPGLILSLLPVPGLSAADQSWLALATTLVQVAPDRPLPSSEQLLAISETLEKASAPPSTGSQPDADASTPGNGEAVTGAAGLSMLYRYLSTALKAGSITQIAVWSLHILRSQENLPPMLTSETQQPQSVPEWIDSHTVDTLDELSNVAAKIKNYQQVDSSQDKLVYLADAVTAAGEALRRAENALLPEKTILRAIATDWSEMVRAELNSFSGRARLRLELRTRQIRRAPQVTVALRLTNTGRAVAESPAVVLMPGDGYTIPSTDKIAFERISSGGSALAEFTITPSAEDEARIVCQVSWTDRIRPDNVFQFGDKVRFYRQSGEFQRIPNPYVAGNPLKTSDLFRGREDVFQFISESLSGTVQDRTLVLHGQRRTGKTSVLYQLLNGRLGPQFIPVLVDMQEMAPLVNSAADLFAEVAYQIARALGKAGLEIVEPDVKEFQPSAVRTFRRFLDKVEDLLSKRRVVLLFDEFEILETKIVEGKLDTDLLGYFRSLIQHRRGLVFIFTGTHRLEEMSTDYWSVLFNLALYKRISYLSPEDAESLIREPVGNTLTYDELAVEKILNLTHCHPYFTQLICFNLVNLCNEQERNYATLNDVNDSVQEIINNGEAHFAYIWQRASVRERAALAGLAHALGPGRAWASPREILETLSEGGYKALEQQDLVEALDGLVGQEVLESTGDGALRYHYQIELIQKWITANKSVAALAERDK